MQRRYSSSVASWWERSSDRPPPGKLTAWANRLALFVRTLPQMCISYKRRRGYAARTRAEVCSMAKKPLRVGLIGAGANTRLRHLPGLLALPDVQLLAVCNRRPESTAAIAREFSIPCTFEHWQDMVALP